MSTYRTIEESRALKSLIIEMAKDCRTQKEIAEKLRLSQRYVSRVLNAAHVSCVGTPYFRQGRARFDKDGYVILGDLSDEERAECRAQTYGSLTRSVMSDTHLINRGR